MSEQKKMLPMLSTPAIRRLPYYLQYLKEYELRGDKYVSANTVAGHFDYTEIQVRKDFAAISESGRPKAGFCVRELIESMEDYLGCNKINKAVLVGAGFLGKAFLSYNGFAAYGLIIEAAFDSDPSIIGTRVNDKPIYDIADMTRICNEMDVNIGVITVPAKQAQLVCDQLVEAGIKGMWNFTPIHLTVPRGVLVQNENMAASLALLSLHLSNEI